MRGVTSFQILATAPQGSQWGLTLVALLTQRKDPHAVRGGLFVVAAVVS